MVDFVRMKQLKESSLNDYYLCEHCKRKILTRNALIKHLQKCSSQSVVCEWCNIKFANRGNMVKHVIELHNGKTRSGKEVRNIEGEFNCTICEQKYSHNWQLWYHIRRVHFNLLAKTPFCQLKKVNQVWFEKVINSSTVMEIKKTSNNSLTMRPLGPNTAIKVHDVDVPVTDLRTLYPTGIKHKKLVNCPHCKKMIDYRSLSKHMETHYNNKRHHCNNCKQEFNRNYLFLRHVCFKHKNQPPRDLNKSIDVKSKKADPVKKDFRSKLLKQMPFGGQVGFRR